MIFEYMIKIDLELGIYTRDLILSYADDDHRCYEPTPYYVLEKLIESGYLTKDNILVDYGCCRGRVAFFLNYKIGCKIIGIELIEKIYERAIKNLATYNYNIDNIEFKNIDAMDFCVDEADAFYFFNPFSKNILLPVLYNIFESYDKNPRYMKLFFYVAEDGYEQVFSENSRLKLIHSIDVRSELKTNPRYAIKVFTI